MCRSFATQPGRGLRVWRLGSASRARLQLYLEWTVKCSCKSNAGYKWSGKRETRLFLNSLRDTGHKAEAVWTVDVSQRHHI